MVLEALEADGFTVNRVTPGKIILGRLGEIETGLRQLIRRRPLEVQTVTLPSGQSLRLPTLSETLRIKAFLVVKRNQVRDYLDVAALAAHIGLDEAAQVLIAIDQYYADPGKPAATEVLDQLLRQLASPAPTDTRTLDQLHRYKGLAPRWRQWSAVETVLAHLAVAIIEAIP
jgi:hypothetical protein